MESDVDEVFLNTDEFGESLTHWPRGEVGYEATVTAIFEEMDPADHNDRGKATERRAKLTVSSSVDVDVRDRWRRGEEEWWNAFRISTDIHGVHYVWVRRVDDEIRSGKTPAVL